MRVLKHGTKYQPARNFHCWHCDCWFEAQPDEYSFDVRRIKKGSGEKATYESIPVPICSCPECGYVVDLKI